MDNTNAQAPEVTALVEALGDLIAISSTLQSVLLGEIGGVERERTLAHWDKRLAEAARLRREVCGAPSDLPEGAAMEAITDEKTNPTGMHGFNIAGQT